jgi:hypothetical protein
MVFRATLGLLYNDMPYGGLNAKPRSTNVVIHFSLTPVRGGTYFLCCAAATEGTTRVTGGIKESESRATLTMQRSTARCGVSIVRSIPFWQPQAG